ncbi:MAG: sulfite exporter TauE/SafE family protein [Candidatus Kapaibacterium sp.]
MPSFNEEHSLPIEVVILCIAAFAAGFVDAIVGGGGLIQIPVGLVLLPQYPVATVIGTTKIPSFCGTSIAAYQYSRHVDLNYKHLALMTIIAGCSAFLGSWTLTKVSNDFMKPLLLVVLCVIAIYTYRKKNFGVHEVKNHTVGQVRNYAIFVSLIIGFYDGFIGPGTGSFLVWTFITLLGLDFLHASADAKFVNLSTNIGSICLFAISGKIIYAFAIPMAVFNAAGGFIGSKLAILKGNSFMRIIFLCVVSATLLKLGYDYFLK